MSRVQPDSRPARNPLLHPRPARQARSRRTQDRLLAAAERVMERAGVPGATVPAIAREAGVSVGTVYRRFRDKDALLAAVYERVFASTGEGLRRLETPAVQALPFEQVAAAFIAGLTRGYAGRRRLLRALVLYALTHRDRQFRRHSARANTDAFRALARLALRHRARIRHPRPALAAGFGMVVVASALRTFIFFDAASPGSLPVPRDLAAELTRLYLAYLGVRRRGTRGRAGRAAGAATARR